MKTLTQYREDIGNLMKKVSDIDAKCVTENREVTEAELALKNEMLDTVDDIRKIVATMERQDRIQRNLEKTEDPLTLPKNTKIETTHDSRSKDRFGSFGEQMAAVMRAGLQNGHVDPRLYNATGLNETTPSDGGFLVQTDFSAEIMRQTFETSILASKCRRVPISGNANSTKINGVDETSRVAGSRYGGIRGYWADEAAEKTASKPKFRQIELNLKKLIGLCYATDEMLDDAAQLEAIIREGFRAEFGYLLDEAIIRGTGAGQPLGILNSGAFVTEAQVAAQGAGTLVPGNIAGMWSHMFASSRPYSSWLINQALEPQLLMLRLTDGDGNTPLYVPPGGWSQAPYGTIFGRPVIPIEQASAVDTAGDFMLCDFSNGYVLAEKGGIKSDMSIHVRFIYDESIFRFVMRVDGQPVRASTLTMADATHTVGHFVVLAGGRA